MSTEAMKWAIELAPPMPSQLVGTLVGLAYHADKQGRGAYPSLARLAAYACKSERSVRRDLRDLENLKLIRQGDQGKAAHIAADKRPTVYDLAVENRVPKGRAGDDEGTWASARTLASSRARGVETRRANKARSEQQPHPEREDVDVRGDADVRPDVDVTAGGRPRHSGGTWTSAKPKDEPTDEQLPKDSSSAAPQTDEPAEDLHLEAFGAFWTVYPKKRAREEAKKAWIAAIKRGADPAHMTDRAQAYARERFGQDPKYTKYPATWLNKGCYDDEPDPQPGPHLRAVSGGYQPWRNPDNQDDYDQPFF
ncbi:helix-turn-helix domain-containing protein [Streptomyces sp. NPDC053367]|uniref:helix-turn-helix domain-containing protein n=1 Tax=Streptomyces sp. NPDC053367 TaxID=3365700 RepID=UPI0037CD83DE